MNSKKLVILYSRLSRDDELDGPSNSIVNQQQLLQEYAERNGLVPFLHIQDDGYSGTRWDRPGWQELIAKVEADEVACVCIKDSSRMGRDYLRVGLYRDANVKHKLKTSDVLQLVLTPKIGDKINQTKKGVKENGNTKEI